MKKYVRGKVLAGQIMSLSVFAFLSFSFFVITNDFSIHGMTQLATIASALGLFTLAEVPIAIVGIVHSTRPYGKFPKGYAIASIAFDGVLSLLLFINFFRQTVVPGSNGGTAVFLVIMAASMTLLLVGTLQAQKEVIHQTQGSTETRSPNPQPNRFDADFVPSAVPPQGASMDSDRTESDLVKLKKLYDSQLINENEYTEKKKEILNRDFSSK